MSLFLQQGDVSVSTSGAEQCLCLCKKAMSLFVPLEQSNVSVFAARQRLCLYLWSRAASLLLPLEQSNVTVFAARLRLCLYLWSRAASLLLPLEQSNVTVFAARQRLGHYLWSRGTLAGKCPACCRVQAVVGGWEKYLFYRQTEMCRLVPNVIQEVLVTRKLPVSVLYAHY